MLGILLPLVFGAAASGASPLQVQTHIAANGLTVMVFERHSVPLVAIELGVRSGSMTEPPEYNGLSHLHEHMFFKANKRVPNQESFRELLRGIGAQVNATTQVERVNFFLTTTSSHLNDAMQLMHDAIVSPRFDDEELDRERAVVAGEIDRHQSGPFYYLEHAIAQRVWWRYPSRKDPLGLRDTVLHASKQQMETIQHRYHVPNNSVLVVVGDVRAAEIFALADRLFADWPRAEDPFRRFPLVSHPAIRNTEVVVLEQPVSVVDGRFVWHGPSIVGPSLRDSYVADVFAMTLTGRATRFQKALVDSGACLEVGLVWTSLRNTGPIELDFAATPAKIDDCVRRIVAELGEMASGYATRQSLLQGAYALEVQVVHERDSVALFAHTLTRWWTSAGPSYYFSYLENAYKVTPADVDRYIATYITDKPYVLGVLVSSEMKRSGLDAAHFEALLGLRAAARAP